MKTTTHGAGVSTSSPSEDDDGDGFVSFGSAPPTLATPPPTVTPHAMTTPTSAPLSGAEATATTTAAAAPVAPPDGASVAVATRKPLKLSQAASEFVPGKFSAEEIGGSPMGGGGTPHPVTGMVGGGGVGFPMDVSGQGAAQLAQAQLMQAQAQAQLMIQMQWVAQQQAAANHARGGVVGAAPAPPAAYAQQQQMMFAAAQQYMASAYAAAQAAAAQQQAQLAAAAQGAKIALAPVVPQLAAPQNVPVSAPAPGVTDAVQLGGGAPGGAASTQQSAPAPPPSAQGASPATNAVAGNVNAWAQRGGAAISRIAAPSARPGVEVGGGEISPAVGGGSSFAVSGSVAPVAPSAGAEGGGWEEAHSRRGGGVGGGKAVTHGGGSALATSSSSTHSSALAPPPISAPGLVNRYGDNNCHLNVVVQALFRLPAFRNAFESAYSARDLTVAEGAPEDIAAAAGLVSAVRRQFSQMTPREGGGGGTSTVNTEGLRRALLRTLAARSSAGGGALAATKSLGERAMADASETLEEVVTLLHEAEARLGGASPALVLPPVGPPPSVSLGTFGLLTTDSASRDGTPISGTRGDAFTALAEHIATPELAAALRARGGAKAPAGTFSVALGDVLARGDARAGVTLSRSLARPARVLTLALGWPAGGGGPANAPVMDAVLDALEPVIDLSVVFRGLSAVTAAEPVPARLRGFIAFGGRHWLAFFNTAAPDATPEWVCANDARVASAPAPLAQARRDGLVPALLFFEAGAVGDALPADRGRASLHGAPSLSSLHSATSSGALASITSWGDMEGDSLSGPPSAFGTPAGTPGDSTPGSFPPLLSTRSAPSSRSTLAPPHRGEGGRGGVRGPPPARGGGAHGEGREGAQRGGAGDRDGGGVRREQHGGHRGGGGRGAPSFREARGGGRGGRGGGGGGGGGAAE